MPFSFYIRDDASDQGKECRVYIQYTYEGKKFRSPATFKGGDPIKGLCSAFIKKREYEKLKNKRIIKSKDRPQRFIIDGRNSTAVINRRLDAIEEQAKNIILMLKQTGRASVDRFKIEWELKRGKSRVFGVIDKYIQLKIEQKKSISTITNIKQLKSRLQEFDSDITFNEFNQDFWGKYMDAKTGHYSKNTLALDQSNLKAFLSWSKGKFHNNPDYYTKWKHIKRSPRKTYLTPEELLRIEAFRNYEYPVFEHVKDIFIFLCHSGMRYNEFTQLNKKSLSGDVITYRSLKQGDEERENKIALSPTLQRIWDKYQGNFPKIDLVRFNRTIKKIALLVKIKKNLSSSVGRHTFGSLMEEFGVDTYTVSRTLGHSNTTTTSKNYQHGVKVNEGAVIFDKFLRKA